MGHGELVKMLLNCAAIVDRSDLEKCVSLLFDSDKIEVIFAVIKFLIAEGDSSHKRGRRLSKDKHDFNDVGSI